MLNLITPDRHGDFANVLIDMFQMRYRVFCERMDWDVDYVIHTDGRPLEMDQYDALRPHYLVYRDNMGQVMGCVRLLPTTKSYMLADTFSSLLSNVEPPKSKFVWEASRIAVDTKKLQARMQQRDVSLVTFELICGTIEFCLANNIPQMVYVVDTRFERILQKCGVHTRRYAEPQRIGGNFTVAGFFDTNESQLREVQAKGDISGPVLWAPVWKHAA